jgi:hypothetical protein
MISPRNGVLTHVSRSLGGSWEPVNASLHAVGLLEDDVMAKG